MLGCSFPGLEWFWFSWIPSTVVESDLYKYKKRWAKKNKQHMNLKGFLTRLNAKQVEDSDTVCNIPSDRDSDTI
jgi:hypothetical protein